MQHAQSWRPSYSLSARLGRRRRIIRQLTGGQAIEAAMIGRDSMLGATSALDGAISLNRAIVQLPGRGETLSVARFREVADQSPSLRTTLLRHEQVLFVQAQQSAACNASHTRRGAIVTLVVAVTRSVRNRYAAVYSGVPRGNARCIAKQCFAGGSHPPTGWPNPLQPGTHRDHQSGRSPGRLLRVLWNGQGALRPPSSLNNHTSSK